MYSNSLPFRSNHRKRVMELHRLCCGWIKKCIIYDNTIAILTSLEGLLSSCAVLVAFNKSHKQVTQTRGAIKDRKNDILLNAED